MTTQSESRAVYGKALGTTLLGLAGLAAQGLLATEAKAESGAIQVATSESNFKFWKQLEIAYPGSPLGVRVSAADVNGDGLLDVAVGSPPGVGDQIKFLSAVTGKHISKGLLDPASTDGISLNFMKITSVPGDLLVVTTPASGPSAGWDLATNKKARVDDLQFSPVDSGDAFPGQIMKHGVHVATGDLNGDGFPEVVFGSSGYQGPPTPGQINPTAEVHSLESDATGNVRIGGSVVIFRDDGTAGDRVAMGDVTGDGVDDLVTTYNKGAYSEVSIYSFQKGTAVSQSSYVEFSSLNIPNASGGDCDVAVGDVNGDGKAELAVSRWKHKGEIELLSWSLPIDSAEGGGVVWSTLSTLQIGPADYLGGYNLAMADVTGDGLKDIIAAPAGIVPEPTSIALIGAATLGLTRRRRKLE